MIGVGNEKRQQVYHNKKRKNGKEKKNVVRRGARGGCSVLLFRNLMYHLVEILSARHGGYVVEFHSRFSPPQHGGCEERKIYSSRYRLSSLLLCITFLSTKARRGINLAIQQKKQLFPSFPFPALPFYSLLLPLAFRSVDGSRLSFVFWRRHGH